LPYDLKRKKKEKEKKMTIKYKNKSRRIIDTKLNDADIY
jgi:hypothetical protein